MCKGWFSDTHLENHLVYTYGRFLGFVYIYICICMYVCIYMAMATFFFGFLSIYVQIDLLNMFKTVLKQNIN